MLRCLPFLLATLLVACSSSSQGPADVPDAPRDLAAADAPDAVPDVPADGAEVAPDAVPDAPVELPYQEPVATVLYDIRADPVMLPWPSDYYHPAGQGLVLDNGNYTSALLPLFSTVDAYQKAIATCDGFAPYAPIVFLTSVAVDPASLPATAAASLADDSPVKLYDVDANGGPGGRQAFLASFRQFGEDADAWYVVTLLPLMPLAQGAPYALVVEDGLRDAAGNRFGRSLGFLRALGQPDPYDGDPERLALEQAEGQRSRAFLSRLPDPDRVVAMTRFTVGRAADQTADILSRFGPGRTPPAVAYHLDEPLAGPDFADCPMPDQPLAWGVSGTFDNLNLTGPDGHFALVDGGWAEFPPEQVRFRLMVPAGPGPFPVVILQHGINNNLAELCPIGAELAARGVASLRFDWPRHGTRGTGAMDFLSVDDALRIRDNFRQGAVDLGTAVTLVKQLAQDVDRGPWGQRDGMPDLDASRMGFLGHSLGGMIATLYLPFDENLQTVVGNVTGVGLFHLIEPWIVDKLFPGQFEGTGPINVAEHLLWPGDGIAFARSLRFPIGSHLERNVLILEVIGDDTVPNRATEALARAAGLSQVEPVLVPIEGCPSAPPASLRSGVAQVQGLHHSDLVDVPVNDQIRALRDTAEHYLVTGLKTGVPEIVPWKATPDREAD